MVTSEDGHLVRTQAGSIRAKAWYIRISGFTPLSFFHYLNNPFIQAGTEEGMHLFLIPCFIKNEHQSVKLKLSFGRKMNSGESTVSY